MVQAPRIPWSLLLALLAACTPRLDPHPVSADAPAPAVPPARADAPAPAVKPARADAPAPAVKPARADAPAPAVKPARADAPAPAVPPAHADAGPRVRCTVTAAEMSLLPLSDGRVSVQVRGSGFLARAVPLGGRLGSQPLKQLQLAPTRGAAAAFIDRMPAPGDRLVLGYLDEEACDTGLVYRGPAR